MTRGSSAAPARLLFALRYELRCAVAAAPALYLPLARFKRSDEDGSTAVTPNSDLALEAFPRSGNTFAYVAFKRSQSRPRRVAHHFHAPAQLIAAVRWRRPALLIVRRPSEAVSSLVQRIEPLTLQQALRSWIGFHRALLDHERGLVVATFEQVVSDFGAVTRRVNDRFGSDFEEFEHSDENVAACFAEIERRNASRFGGGRTSESSVARPSEGRSEERKRLLRALEAPALAPALARAEELYEHYARLATDPAGTPAGGDRDA